MNWQPHAARLADTIADPGSRWHAPLADLPRHLFVPRWWQRAADGWTVHHGASDDEQWLDTAYRDTSLVTRVGPLHADHAKPDDNPRGLPTSSATLPSLVVRMFRHAHINDGDRLLDVGTGSGYGAALAARRLSEEQVISVDVDPYLVDAARDRAAQAGLHPRFETTDATGPLPFPSDSVHCVVSTVGLRPVPAGLLDVLRPGGRLVTTIAGTTLIVTTTKNADGGATGRVEWDRAGFMQTRHGTDYTLDIEALLSNASEHTSTSPYPVVDVDNAWDLQSMLDVTAPGIVHHYTDTDGTRTALMTHPDGSWARARAHGTDPATVDQGGPRRLWDILDTIRAAWLADGELPVRGARVFIEPDGTTHLARGKWHIKL